MDEFVSYAQNFEDVVLWRALRHIDRGFYIDAGAAEPDVDSVTAAFYERGWSGINIEPAPNAFARLAAARPRDLNLEGALGAAPGEQDFLLVNGGNGLSTLEPSRRAELTDEGWTVTTTRVQVFRLDDICREHVKGDIHFLKIDVEGAERAVLEGAALATWRPWIIVIEATRPNSTEASYDGWEDLVLANQYSMVYDDGLNRFYLATEHGDMAKAFSAPPNVHDRFIKRSEYQAKSDANQLYAQVKSLDVTIQSSNANLQRLNQIITAMSEERKALETRLIATTGERDSTVQKLAECNAIAATLRADKTQLGAHIRDLNAELKAVYESTSWRLTEPVRRIKRWRQGT